MDKLNSFPLPDIQHLFKHPLSHADTCANIHESESRYIIPLLFS